MELAFITYLVLQLDAIRNSISQVIGLISVVSLGALLAFLIFYLEKINKGIEFIIKAYKVLLPITILLVTIKTLLPSSDSAKYILGAYGVQTAVSAVSENEDVKRIASKSLSAVESMLDKVSEQNKEKK